VVVGAVVLRGGGSKGAGLGWWREGSRASAWVAPQRQGLGRQGCVGMHVGLRGVVGAVRADEGLGKAGAEGAVAAELGR
jgi:hypothetical protein